MSKGIRQIIDEGFNLDDGIYAIKEDDGLITVLQTYQEDGKDAYQKVTMTPEQILILVKIIN